MRKQTYALFASLMTAAAWWTLAYAAEAGSQQVGLWTGTWEGAGSGGRFDLTLAAGGDSKITGSVSVGMDGGDYTAKFSSISFDGNKMTGKYAYPPDEQGEVAVTATFEGDKATGTWALGGKGQDAPAIANGTWTVSKK